MQKRYYRDLLDYISQAKELFNSNVPFASNQPQNSALARKIFEDQLYKMDSIVKNKVIRLLENDPDDRILSIGCGLGATETILSIAGYRVVGMDVAIHSLRTARSIAIEKQLDELFYLASDAACLSFKDNSFDSVFSNQVLEHVPDIWNSHKELYRVLKPGGTYLGITANYIGILSPVFESPKALEGTDSILRRIYIIPHIVKRLLRGVFCQEYTQNIPFDKFNFGEDHKFVEGLKRHIDPQDLHACNPFEIKRILKRVGFKNIRVYVFYSKKTFTAKVITAIYSLPLLNIIGGPDIIAVANK